MHFLKKISPIVLTTLLILSPYLGESLALFENGLRNTSKTDPKKFWGILNRIDRSSEKEKISIDNFYTHFITAKKKLIHYLPGLKLKKIYNLIFF
jgi:hypothetical protein